MTQSIRVVGPRQWSYMAARLEESFRAIANKRKVEGIPIVRGVYADAKEFFDLISQAIECTVPANPPASINAYSIATNVICSAFEPQPKNTGELKASLQNYIAFFNDLHRQRDLSQDEVGTARSLEKFFRQLKLAGEAEAYEQGVQFSFPQFQ